MSSLKEFTLERTPMDVMSVDIDFLTNLHYRNTREFKLEGTHMGVMSVDNTSQDWPALTHSDLVLIKNFSQILQVF